MNYNLSKILLELTTLPEYKNQLYLQGNRSDMDPIEPTRGQNYLYVDDNELEYNINLFDIY